MSAVFGTRDRTAPAIAAAFVALYLVVQLAGLTTVGLTDDDDFYIPAGISYAGWLGRAATFEPRAWTRAGIDEAFLPNHEHPPLAKYVFGVCHFALRGWLGPTDSARVGAVLFSTVAAALLLWLAWVHLGPRRGLIAGGFSVLALLTLPRFYFHSHAATLDVPVATMYLAAASFALMAERSRPAALWAGVMFGLASATKLNGPFLVVPYLMFIALTRWRRPSTDRDGLVAGHVRLPPLPLALLSMLVVGPIVFFAVWPWMWFDTVARVSEYVGFHLNHYGIYFLYFGRLYDKDPFAPWHAPFTMAAITVPVAISLLALVGVGAGAKVVLHRLRTAGEGDSTVRREGDLVLTAGLHALVSVAVVAASGGPKYGGAKLFMPFFPFWCLLAGYGVLRLHEAANAIGSAAERVAPTERASASTARPRSSSSGQVRALAGMRNRFTRAVPAAAAGLALLSSMALQIRFGGYALSQYNVTVGGLRGATAVGFERQYYDIAFRDLVAWLNEHASSGARVHFLPNNKEYLRTYRWYRRAGELRSDIRVVRTPDAADVLVLNHERRFSRYGEDLMRYRGRPILAEHVIDGVPIWTVLQLR